MKLSDQGEPIFSANDIIQEIYRGNLDKISVSKMYLNDTEYLKYLEFLNSNQIDDWPFPEPFLENVSSTEDFDKKNQDSWFMPEEYKILDIEHFLLSRCKTEEERSRVQEELVLFKQHEMTELLKFLKYLVDTMRENNIFWGVGRGSSVASFCLYLIGIHKIDPIKYKLDIREFLKGE